MKKFISILLSITMIATSANIVFANDVEKGDILTYNGVVGSKDNLLMNISDETPSDIITVSENVEESCIPNKNALLSVEDSIEPMTLGEIEGLNEDIDAVQQVSALQTSDFTFNSNLLTKFNTITGPEVGNGANEPKFSYNSFLEENVSDYSGELTLNFEDLVLDGVNGLDLRIGRTYQTVASGIGEKTLMILPNENGYLRNNLVNNYSTYLLDRYNLGMGWGFSFPSVQIETEYIPQEVVDTYYYDEETELYYHSGNGEVYKVVFTSDTTDSNLEGYYKKDIQFNKNDKGYSNGQVTSYYSMTLADKTKQYFAEDGRLIGIVDRFGNTIKFEHTLSDITNRVPEGNFRYDDDMWTVSTAANGTYDAFPVDDMGRNDTYSMWFRRDNEDGDSYIISQPIQVKPLTTYNLGISVYSEYSPDVKVEIIGYDTAYNYAHTRTKWITDYNANEWYDYTCDFSMSSAVRYIIIKITPDYAKHMYIDNVRLDEPKPLISKITDSVGRTVEFTYTGDLFSSEATGSVTLLVKSPDGTENRTLTYTKEPIEFVTEYQKHQEQRLFWYLKNSNTEGEDGATVRYTYEGGTTENSDGTLAYPPLYIRYDSKTHSANDGWINKPVLSSVRYKDRQKMYEYETVRKHLGDDGYYDTLRVKKKYDMYAYVPEGATKTSYKGELLPVTYSYGGTYNSNSYDNETGYPNYKFDDTTNLNELWTVTKSGKTTDTVTFSNYAVKQQTSTDNGVTTTSEYTNHTVFKNSPTQIKNTVSENGESNVSYIMYSYNDWGGVISESKEVGEEIKNNSALLEKYNTNYEYESNYHNITQKSYYNNVDMPQVCEKFTYDTQGRLIESEDAAKKKTQYSYSNSEKPYLLTKTTQDDPMGFHKVLGNNRKITYGYDTYGLYPVVIEETYSGGVARTQYVYDYITGDILREILPDNSYTDYQYYSDGKIKNVISPCTQALDGRLFYTVENHTYHVNTICEDYAEEVPAYSVDEITKYRIYADDNPSQAMYGAEINFYDAVGNLKMHEQYDFSKKDENNYYLRYKTKYYHDNYDRLIKTTNNEGSSVQYVYDGFDRPIQVTDKEGKVYTYTYNSVQNTATMTLAGNEGQKNLGTMYYDLYGNNIKARVYPDNSSNYLEEIYEYDLNGNVISYTDPNGNETEYTYDALNRLKETLLPNGEKATANYSSFDEPSFEKIYGTDGTEKSARITYRNEKGDVNMRFFNYDKRLVESSSYSADAKGRTVSINEGENPKSLIYDETNHPIILTSGTSQIHRRYNWFGEVAAASTDGQTPEIRYGYDARGNLAAKLQNDDYYMGYAYSTINNIVLSQMPSSRTESYTYTANGNLDTIVSDSKTYDYEYYDTGLVKSLTYPNGLKTEYIYDNIGRVTNMITTKGNATINSLSYTYDNNGNILTYTRNGQVTSYTYDSLDRLLSVTYPDSSTVVYTYDALNNLTKETFSNGNIKEYFYNHKYQLKEIKLNGTVTDTYTYNQTGAVTSHNEETYTYDEWDRMSGYSDGTNAYTYKYDTNGIRTQKNDKQYIIDINNNVVAETDSAGDIESEILWGNGKPLARKTNGSWYYYIYNAHGDVVGLVNDTGTVVNTYEYTPWGEIHNETEIVDNPIKYAGEYYDDELGMYYLRARYYDPSTKRFTSYDIEEGEILNPLDMNRYVYCRNNPIKYVDPTGMLAYPGQIHNLVVNRVASIYGLNKEQTISYKYGWGRADLISNSGAVWDVKRDKPKQIAGGVAQVLKYTQNTWKKNPNIKLSVGGNIESGEFIQTINVDTYYISYRYAGNGVIAYDYYKITDWDTVKSYAATAGMTLLSALAFLLSQGTVQLQPVY